ncbi:phage baseplate protein [Paenibacillus sp. FSL H8-0122]|uniref:phage baseplate protein n=1 Tax=Paenibacillus sp. FSL H8-0122 TaxID=2954510 RepID=UPI0030F5D0A2
MALIDGKYITVQSESPDFPVTATEQPVEKGINLVDHVQAQARTISLSGIISGPDAAKTRAYLITAKDKGQIVKYVGRNAFTGIITGFSTPTDYTTANGMTFSLELREIRIAASSYVDTLPPPIKAQAAPIVNSGTKQTKDKSSKDKPKDKGKGKDKDKDKNKDKVEKVKFKSGSKWNK